MQHLAALLCLCGNLGGRILVPHDQQVEHAGLESLRPCPGCARAWEHKPCLHPCSGAELCNAMQKPTVPVVPSCRIPPAQIRLWFDSPGNPLVAEPHFPHTQGQASSHLWQR